MIYLDYQATTPLAPEVAAAMRPWLETSFGNPHSPHRIGREAAAAIEVAREKVCIGLQDQPSRGRLHFTSGATEAANWALKGAAARLPEDRRRIVTIATEHACVLDTVSWLRSQGFGIDVVPVGSDGLVDLNRLGGHIDDRTGIVAAMLVNNEIGVVQPIADIAALAHSKGALFFCDAVQGFGRAVLPLHACDMVAISAHKVHGPKGIGGLWLRDGIEIEPLLHGGGQEGGIRSGTLSPALCVGFGEAARLLSERRDSDHRDVEGLWRQALAGLGEGWRLNGSAEERYRGNLNVRRDGIDSARLLSEARHVAFSSGSACASGSGRPSHVLAALGLDDRQARSSIRLGFGRYTRQEELAEAIGSINEAAERQRRLGA